MIQDSNFTVVLEWFKQHKNRNVRNFPWYDKASGETYEEAGVSVYPADAVFKTSVKPKLRSILGDPGQYKELCRALGAEEVRIRNGKAKVFITLESDYGFNVWWA